jgi:hypothetical protein
MAYSTEYVPGKEPTQLLVLAGELALFTDPYADRVHELDRRGRLHDSVAAANAAAEFATAHPEVTRIVVSGADDRNNNGHTVAREMVKALALGVTWNRPDGDILMSDGVTTIPDAVGPHSGLLRAVRQGLIDPTQPLGLVAHPPQMRNALNAAHRVAPDMLAVPIVVKTDEAYLARGANLRDGLTRLIYNAAMLGVPDGDSYQIDRRDHMVQDTIGRLGAVTGRVIVPIYAARHFGRIGAAT